MGKKQLPTIHKSVAIFMLQKIMYNVIILNIILKIWKIRLFPKNIGFNLFA